MALSNIRLNQNEVYATLANLIISVQTFADKFKGLDNSLVDKAKVDANLYGDKKLYVSVHAPDVYAWPDVNDGNQGGNVLKPEWGKAPEVQELTLDTFKQVGITTSEYMSKRAFGTPESFSQFNSVMLGLTSKAKRVYEHTTYNTYIGTAESEEADQNVEITLPVDENIDAMNTEATNRIHAQTIATEIADIMTTLKDVNEMNDLGILDAYDVDDLIIVWNADWVNKIKKTDLPTIYRADKVFNDFKYVLPAFYFGTINTETATTLTNPTRRALKAGVYDGTYHRAGQEAQAGAEFGAGTSYDPDATIVCKIMHKDSVPMLAGFETMTSFFNGKRLDTTQWLTFGHSDLAYLKNYPFITVRARTTA